MDILLINPYSQESFGTNEATVEVPIGLLSLASFLESKGIKVGFLDANAQQWPQQRVVDFVNNTAPKTVGISVNIFSFLQAIRYTEEIKRISKDITVVWGGPQPTIDPELCLERSKVDFIVIGEGELTLFESLECILGKESFRDIKGIAYRQDNGIKINLPRERIGDLDSLPLPAYHRLPNLRYYKSRARKIPFMGIMTSRGCPFNCIYCSKAVFKNRITMRSPKNIITEIDLLVNKYHIKQIDILDDNFTTNKRRVEQLCELLISRNYKICINLQSGIRADNVDEALIRKLKTAGVFKVGLGVETGNQAIASEIGRELDLDKVLVASRLARKYGMIVIGFFMIGLPGDNEQTLQETIDFAIKMNPHMANFTMTIPFYGTELYRLIEREGKFLFDTREGVTYGFYAAKAYYELGNLTTDLMVKYYRNAYRKFYFRFTKAIDILCTVRSFREFKWLVEISFKTYYFQKKGNKLRFPQVIINAKDFQT